ncbi:hypothetical protein SDC9_99130 [bioreactor metagenome]|uniref:Uncharacterized protein n=1 Tax=bioreactor metagenome TaxID=1076179 RepID=A0A645AJA2_9ZZZZ
MTSKFTCKITNVIINRGTATKSLFFIGFWSYLKKSAVIKRADLNAVSPDVNGAATTPNNARNPPKLPNHDLEIRSTTTAGLLAVGGKPATNSCKP